MTPLLPPVPLVAVTLLPLNAASAPLPRKWNCPPFITQLLAVAVVDAVTSKSRTVLSVGGEKQLMLLPTWVQVACAMPAVNVQNAINTAVCAGLIDKVGRYIDKVEKFFFTINPDR